MGARYTSVDLKDGRELLVPNEDLVTQRVINWTYSSDLMRLEVKFSTTYDSDLHKTRAAAVAGRAERRAGAEGAAAGLPPDRLWRDRDRIRAVVLDQGRRHRPDRRALRGDDRAVGHVRARGRQAADPGRDACRPRTAEVTADSSRHRLGMGPSTQLRSRTVRNASGRTVDINNINHVGMAVRDLAATAARYEAMGFKLTPYSPHSGAFKPGEPVKSLGSGNRCVMFENNYLEILANEDPNPGRQSA